MSLNILIVDDSDVIRSMVARTLRLAKVPLGVVHEASNGREALALLEEEWVDLVLADLNMPVMTGIEMIERMRADSEMADIPVMVISSEGATARITELMQQGVTSWIRKPFTPEEIRDAVVGLTTGMVEASDGGVYIDAVFSPVLETFAFVVPEPIEPSEIPAEQGDFFSASLSFSGATTGVLTVSAPSELCIEFAANILGADPDDPDARMRGADTLGEVANIAAGHLATMLEPSDPTNLHPPVVSQIDRAEWEWQLACASARVFSVEGLPIVVTLRLRTVARVG